MNINFNLTGQRSGLLFYIVVQKMRFNIPPMIDGISKEKYIKHLSQLVISKYKTFVVQMIILANDKMVFKFRLKYFYNVHYLFCSS